MARAFHHPDQALHDPQQYMRFGRVVPPKDLPERTERLLAAVRGRGIGVSAPEPCGLDPIHAVHAPHFVAFLQSAWDEWQALPAERGPEAWPSTFPYWSGRPNEDARPPCPSTGFLGRLGWYLGDLSVPVGPNCWTSTLRSAETAVAGADALIRGERLAYALCRPSGHHARADRASGFCYLNNSAIAAQRIAATGARVAILDVDAHHGDGTQQIFYRRGDVLTVSIHADPDSYYPFYTGYAHETGHGPGTGANLNLPLPHGSGIEAMERALDIALARIRDFGAEVLVVALGFDAHEEDPIGVLKLTSADFARVGAAIAAIGLPTLAVQEGGYAVDAIGSSLDAFLQGMGA